MGETLHIGLTGSDATLRRDLPLSAEAGSYSLSGTTATLSLTRSLAAGAGAYSLTGSDASLSHVRSLAAGAGAYSLTGRDASLLHRWVLAAGGGSYTLTGTAATLTRFAAGEHVLSAEPGSIPVSGSSVLFSVQPGVPVVVTPTGGGSLSGGVLRGRRFRFPGYPDALLPPRVFVLSARGAAIPVAGRPVLFRREISLAGAPLRIGVRGVPARFQMERRIAGGAELMIFGTAQMSVERYDWVAYDNDFLLAAA